MALVRRLLCGMACAAAALQPVVAMANPSPSPALDGVLAAPPASDFVEIDASTSGAIEGPFDAKRYTTLVGSADPTSAQKVLESDGFLSGYGRSWRQPGTKHLLVEAVLAFNGGLGSSLYLQQTQTYVPSQYQGAIAVTGIPQYYGERLWDATSGLHADYFVFVKGNDAFVVTVASPKDDIGDIASTQAQKQYESAPFFTISPTTWPELQRTRGPAINVGVLLVFGIAAVLVLGLVVVLAVLVFRSRKPRAAVAFAGALPVIQLSPDHQFWWDGLTWRDAALEAPSVAQRSGDGRFWWDGTIWRPVPTAPAPHL